MAVVTINIKNVMWNILCILSSIINIKQWKI